METKPLAAPRAPRIKDGIKLTPRHALKIGQYLDASVPDKHRIATERALRKQVSLSVAVRIKCLQCCGYQREEIALCPVITCPLHCYRPYQPKAL